MEEQEVMVTLRAPRYRTHGADSLCSGMTILAMSLGTGLASCSHRETDSVEVLIDTTASLTIRLGYAIHPLQCGTLQDGLTGDRTFYFANTLTGRMLKRFDDQGHLLQSVPLSDLVDSSGIDRWSLTMVDPDSILLVSEAPEPEHYLALLNGQGGIEWLGSLRDALVDTMGNRYELRVGAAGDQHPASGTLLQVAFAEPSADTITYATDHAYLHSYYGEVGKGAHLAVLDWVNNGPTFDFGQYGFYNRSCARGDTAPRSWADHLCFTGTGAVIHHFSRYSSWVHRLDGRMTSLDSFRVTTELGPCHLQLPELTESETAHMQDSSDVRNTTHNYIFRVTPCPPFHVLLVAIMKGAPIAESGQPGWRPEWSWVIHDTNGHRLGETHFASDTYDGWCVLWNKDRAWVKRASTPQERREGILHFDRLTLSR